MKAKTQPENAGAAAVSNALIAEEFNELGDLIELEGGDQFRARAYHNAARTLAQLSRDVAAMVLHGEDLKQLPGVGEGLAKKIEEIAHTGTCKVLEEMRRRVPAGLRDLLDVPGLGPARVRMLHEELGIYTKQQLAEAARDGKLRRLKRFGPKLESKILKSVTAAQAPKRFKLATVEPQARELLDYISSVPGVRNCAVAGSYRRSKDTVGDLDIVIESQKASALVPKILQYPQTASSLSAGPTRVSLVLKSGLQVDVRIVEPKSFGAALYYFTGSKAHNIAVRDMASKAGLLLNEYGLFSGKRQIAGQSEESIFEALGMQFIAPELRENEGEIEASQFEALPNLISLSDIRGDLHAHSFDGDGRHSIEEMARAAQLIGLKYLAITDHSPHATAAGGLTIERLRLQMKEIDRLNHQLSGIKLLKGAEVEIRVDGTLDLPDDVLGELDVVICAANSFLHLKKGEQTERFLRAMDNPYCDIIAHPTGRLLLQRDACELDMLQIIRKAADKGIFLEVNGHPDRLDLDGRTCQAARDEGARLALTADAHAITDFANLRLSVGQARRGWLEARDAVNSLPLPQLRRLLHGHRQRAPRVSGVEPPRSVKL